MMIIHTYLSAKSDKIINEIDEYSETVRFLGTKNKNLKDIMYKNPASGKRKSL